MLNMDQTTLTPRKIEALVAVYLGHKAHWRIGPDCYGGVHPRAGQPIARAGRTGGGGSRRMVEALVDQGYLTYRRELTLKGYDAIITHVGGRLASYINPAELEERREDRRIFEATEAVRFEQEENRRKAERRLREHATRTKKLGALHELFAPGGAAIALFGFDPTRGVILEGSDDAILTVADRIARIMRLIPAEVKASRTPSDRCRELEEALTPSADTKAAYIGWPKHCGQTMTIDEPEEPNQ